VGPCRQPGAEARHDQTPGLPGQHRRRPSLVHARAGSASSPDRPIEFSLSTCNNRAT
jgi:hypothetical protein